MPRIKPPRSELALKSEPVPNEDLVIDLDTPIEEPKEIELTPREAGTPPAPIAPRATEPEPKDDDAVKRALEATQRAEGLQRQLAQLQAQQAAREQELTRDRDDLQYNSVLSAIGAEQAILEKAESDYAALASAGDWANAAKAQGLIAKASARIDRLEDNKSTFENRREELKRQPPAPAPQPVEAGGVSIEIERLNVPEAAKAYLRSHPDLISDESKRNRLGRVHNYIQDKIVPYSEDYFKRLDDEFGFKQEPAPAPAAQPRRSMPVSAPVSREVHAPNGQRRTNSITLTPQEREIARTSYTAPDLTNEQKERLYAENKAKLLRMRDSGEYRHTTEQTG